MKSGRAPLLFWMAVLGAGPLLMAASATPVDAAALQTAGPRASGGVQAVTLALSDVTAPQPALQERPLQVVLGEPSTLDLSGRSVAATRIGVATTVEPSTRSDGLANSRVSDADPGWPTWLLATLGIVGFVAARRRVAD